MRVETERAADMPALTMDALMLAVCPVFTVSVGFGVAVLGLLLSLGLPHLLVPPRSDSRPASA